MYDIQIRKLAPQPVASIRLNIAPDELSMTIGRLLPEVLLHLETIHIHPAGPPFTRYHRFDEDVIDLETGYPVNEIVPPSGLITPGDLPGGEAAATIHTGPYDTLPQAYTALVEWLKDHQREAGEAPWEVYWRGPGDVPNPLEWKTEVILPLQMDILED